MNSKYHRKHEGACNILIFMYMMRWNWFIFSWIGMYHINCFIRTKQRCNKGPLNIYDGTFYKNTLQCESKDINYSRKSHLRYFGGFRMYFCTWIQHVDTCKIKTETSPWQQPSKDGIIYSTISIWRRGQLTV